MRRLHVLIAFIAVHVVSLACVEKQDKNTNHSEDSIIASGLMLKSVMYYYTSESSCGSEIKDFLFTGDDLKHPIFASIIEAPKAKYERSSACQASPDKHAFLKIKLKLNRSDGSSETLASPFLGCGEGSAPDLTGVLPPEFLSDILEILQPKNIGSSLTYQQNNLAVYHYRERVEHADLASFEVLIGSYAQDKSRVYYGGKTIEKADRNSFQAITAGWAKDGNYVYFDGQIVDGADPQSLTLDAKNPKYAKDSTKVFYQGKMIPGMDPLSFTCLDSSFCKDGNQVLFMNQVVSDVDATSFAVDSCADEFPKQPKQMLCSIPPNRGKLICQVHDKNRSFSLEH